MNKEKRERRNLEPTNKGRNQSKGVNPRKKAINNIIQGEGLPSLNWLTFGKLSFTKTDLTARL